MLRQAQHERKFLAVTVFFVAVGFLLRPHTVPALTVEEVALLKTPDRQKVLEEGGVERMNEAFNALQTVSHKMAEALYQQTSSSPAEETTEQSSAAGASAGGQTGGEDNVIDAEYVDVDEDKK